MGNAKAAKIGLVLFALGSLAGCATSRESRERPPDFVRSYEASLPRAWSTALDAAEQQGLQISRADKAMGVIVLRRAVAAETVGEHVDLLFRELDPSRTALDVSCHQMGFELYTLKQETAALLQRM